jgi:hypothetical protein
MLCPKCKEIDFQFVDDLPQSQQQELQSVGFGKVQYWKQDDAQHYYYYILHDTFTALTLSVEQGCHLCSVIYTAFSSPQKTKALNVVAAANQITPVVLRSWSSKQKMPFTENVLARASSLKDITVTYHDMNIELRLLEGLNDLSSVQWPLD